VNTELTNAIDALLPQTQCTKCGYTGCLPYAKAIAAGDADINQCPPGGAEIIGKLAMLLGRAPKPLNPANGIEQPRTAALIDESRCIGCMLCIQACPVDAIVGAAKQMHTVITAACTGCDLCLPPCPVDCIEMVELSSLAARGNRHAAELARQSIRDMADTARSRYRFHQFRIAREKTEREERLASKADAKLAHLESLPGSHDLDRKKAAVRAAIERARTRRIGIQNDTSKAKK
jgi:electron transport complex protein RnfB